MYKYILLQSVAIAQCLAHQDITNIRYLGYRHATLVRVSCISETMVALGTRDPISLRVGLPLPRVGKKAGHALRHWHALDKNEYTCQNIAVSENSFLSVLVQC